MASRIRVVVVVGGGHWEVGGWEIRLGIWVHKEFLELYGISRNMRTTEAHLHRNRFGCPKPCANEERICHKHRDHCLYSVDSDLSPNGIPSQLPSISCVSILKESVKSSTRLIPYEKKATDRLSNRLSLEKIGIYYKQELARRSI